MAFLKFQNQMSKPLRVIFGPMSKATMTFLRAKASSFDCGFLQTDGIDIYASDLNKAITSIASQCIPNHHVRIRPFWLSPTLKIQIHKRKRALKRAKVTDLESYRKSFKIYETRLQKWFVTLNNQNFDKIADKLESTTLSVTA